MYEKGRVAVAALVAVGAGVLLAGCGPDSEPHAVPTQTKTVVETPTAEQPAESADEPAPDEPAYDDDAAAVRFVLTRPPAPAGIAFVRVLASCRRVRVCLTS